MSKIRKFGACAIALSLICSCFSYLNVVAADNAVIATYDSKAGFKASTNGGKQGADHWYYREYSAGKSTELKYSGGKNGNAWGWYNEDYTASVREDAMNASASCDTEMTFVSDFKGVIRIKSSIYQMSWTNYIGDGVAASISKNSKELWAEDVLGKTPSETEITVSVKKGDEINFRINCKSHNAYDAFAWWPVVERIEGEYISDDSYTYYQYTGNDKKEIKIDEDFNDGEGGYLSDEYFVNGSGFMTDSLVMASENTALGKTLTLPADGKYRVYGNLNATDTRGGGNVLSVLNGENLLWKQLFIPGEEGKFDIRFRALKGDVVTVKVEANDYVGYNAAEWQCEIEGPYIPANDLCDATTVSGLGGATLDNGMTIGAIATSGSDKVRVYSVKYDKEYPMEWDSSSKTWKSQISGDGGYISETKAMPGYYSETVMEQELEKDGTVRFSGKYGVSGNSDGVLAKIFIIKKDTGAEELLWSSRVGGERSVRWDEKYDACYFDYNVNVVENVKAGDKVKYVFNHWRLINNDNTDINTVKLNYITAPVLSETTKWKLKQSIVLDTESNKVYKDGVEQSVTVKVEEDTTYILKSDAQKLGLSVNGAGGDYIPVRSAAEAAGKAVNWVADRIVTIYDGIPVMFGYGESAEIKAVFEKGGSLF